MRIAPKDDGLKAQDLHGSESEAEDTEYIVVSGAQEHNLRSVSVRIPKGKLTVFTGPSGSGKSSLAFDTIFAEGRRRYLESLSVYARQFVGEMRRPIVDDIRGLGPTIAIDQRTVSNNPRSTVGTITEIYDFMRILWSRVGIQSCTNCGKSVGRSDPQTIVRQILAWPTDTQFVVLSPLVKNRKGAFKDVIEKARKGGYSKIRVDGETLDLGDDIDLKKTVRHRVELVVDRLKLKDGIESRLLDSIKAALEASGGECLLERREPDGRVKEWAFSEHLSCSDCELAFPELSAQSFSFNSPIGACERCQGLGVTEEIDPALVVPDDTLSLAGGAIAAWNWPGKQNPITLAPEILESVCIALGFAPDTPFRDLTEEQRRKLLFGSPKPIDIKWSRRGVQGSYPLIFSGLVTDLLDQYRSSTRDAVRTFLASFIVKRVCSNCEGTRLRAESCAVQLNENSNSAIQAFNALTVEEAARRFEEVTFEGARAIIAREIIPEIRSRLSFLSEVGLGYLQLNRPGPTLSGGESQRIRLASQLGSGLTGVTYVLDEPSIGLHARDQHRLLKTLADLRERGNTIVVVEHDESTMLAADYLVDFGPGAGHRGGQVTYAGSGHDVIHSHSLTAEYLSGRRRLEVPQQRRTEGGRALWIRGAQQNNLKNIDVEIPLNRLVCVTGVSGAGKSTLINEILLPLAEATLHRARRRVGEHEQIEGLEFLDRVIAIDQKPIGRTPRSNPATYTKLFDLIRTHFSLLPESKIYGYPPGRFSFNVAGGRCETCGGAGIRTIEMQFLADTYVPCESCRGKRFNEATLRVTYRGRSIAEVLKASVEEALDLFSEHPAICRILETLNDVGLGYLELGQPSTTLSGGEAQRIKLSRELARPQRGHTLYVLDEPSTGLHYEDIRHLLAVLNRLVDSNNTVVVIEHNLDIIKSADYLIDLGPEGGEGGGHVVAFGTPEDVVEANTHTATALASVLARSAAISSPSMS